MRWCVSKVFAPCRAMWQFLQGVRSRSGAKACPPISVLRSRRTPRHALLLGDVAHFEGGSVLSKMMQVAHVRLSDSPAGVPVFAIKWAPWSEYAIPEAVRSSLPVARVINDTNFSCRKSVVGKCFEKVFGYPILVDPVRHDGWYVLKSERNAMHDGKVLHSPGGQLGPDTVAQVLVNNRVTQKFVEDIRVPIVGRRIPFAYLKYRPVKSRFSNENSYVLVSSQHEVFSSAEIRQLAEFVSAVGLEYGELDVLRDRDSGRIYIVDANNTPYGPPNRLAPRESHLALRVLTDAFMEEFAGRGAGSY